MGAKFGGLVDAFEIAQFECVAVAFGNRGVGVRVKPVPFVGGNDCAIVDAFVDEAVAVVVDAVHGEEEGVAVVVDKAVTGQDDVGDVGVVGGVGKLVADIPLRCARQHVPQLPGAPGRGFRRIAVGHARQNEGVVLE